MNFEEMQQQWTAQDQTPDPVIQINLGELRGSHVYAAATALQRLTRSLGLELVVNAIVMLVLSSFVSNHLREPRFLAPALLLHGCAIALVAANIRQLVLLRRVDYAGPIVAMQRTLATLRLSRIRTTKWTFVVAPLLWVPMLITGLRGLLGVDAYWFLDAGWIAVNILFGVAVIPLTLWLARLFRGSRLLQRIADSFAGQSLNDAKAFLDQVARFER
jgi:hypothetical protein